LWETGIEGVLRVFVGLKNGKGAQYFKVLAKKRENCTSPRKKERKEKYQVTDGHFVGWQGKGGRAKRKERLQPKWVSSGGTV